MRFYSGQECEGWLAGRERRKPDSIPGVSAERVRYPAEPHRVYSFANWIVTSLTHRLPALLWITEWGIWPSSENLHLYYRLRQSYRDARLLEEAPGHLFLAHETEDMATFLQAAMLNGWGGYVLTEADYVNAFFSHDEFIDFFAETEVNLSDVRSAFAVGAPTPGGHPTEA
ncbi:MAG: hypothetical protein JWO31_3067 [Phycisphaerales bacterium]|nr:hypothetical protein [Phycisphaerales bacterium]